MLDDMQFLEDDDSSEDERGTRDTTTSQEKDQIKQLKFFELQEKYGARPDLFQFNSNVERKVEDLKIGLHKGLRQAFNQLVTGQEEFISTSRDISSYLELCQNQIDQLDYNDIADFEAFFDQLIQMGHKHLKDQNQLKKYHFEICKLKIMNKC